MAEPRAFHSSIPLVLSPNRAPRKRPAWLGTVIHYTASKPGTRGDIAWLCDPRAGASAHFIIGRDGGIVQLVPVDEIAWHAGISELPVAGGKPIRGCNETCLGIELDNHGPIVEDEDQSGRFLYEEGTALKPYAGPPPVEASLAWPGGAPLFASWWEPFPEPQIEALSRLLKMLGDAGHKDAVHNLLGHDEVALPSGRKRDPGAVFPWERFVRRQPRKLSSQRA